MTIKELMKVLRKLSKEGHADKSVTLYIETNHDTDFAGDLTEVVETGEGNIILNSESTNVM
jgi:hypothetical protein